MCWSDARLTRMSDHHISAAEAYVVKQGGLIYVRFSKDRKPNRDVVFAEPRGRTVNGATGEKGPWEASWSWVTVVVSYDGNDDLHDIQIIGVPSRRPASGPEDRPEPP
jgi:hypothetical protein